MAEPSSSAARLACPQSSAIQPSFCGPSMRNSAVRWNDQRHGDSRLVIASQDPLDRIPEMSWLPDIAVEDSKGFRKAHVSRKPSLLGRFREIGLKGGAGHRRTTVGGTRSAEPNGPGVLPHSNCPRLSECRFRVASPDFQEFAGQRGIFIQRSSPTPRRDEVPSHDPEVCHARLVQIPQLPTTRSTFDRGCGGFDKRVASISKLLCSGPMVACRILPMCDAEFDEDGGMLPSTGRESGIES